MTTGSSPQPTKPGNRKLWFLLASLIVLVAFVLWMRPGKPSKPPQDGSTSSASSPRGIQAARPTASDPQNPDLASLGFDPNRTLSELRIQRAIEDYREVSIYPPWSRPHNEGTRYKLEWNKPVVSDLGFSDKAGSETMYHFASDKAHVMFGEPITSWIEVWKKADPAKRMYATIQSAWVMSVDGPKPGRSVPLTYKDDGQNGDDQPGDFRYSNRFVPSEHAELRDSRQVYLLALVEVEGESRQMIREFTYSPRPVLEVLSIQDSVRDGHLVLSLGVRTYESGMYSFEMNLFGKGADEDKPIAYADATQRLSPGEGMVEVAFFGRTIVESKLDGPYLVKDIRGFLKPVGSEQMLWFSDARVHATKAYKHTDFSGAEWDSPEKREKLAGMDSMLNNARTAGKAAPGTLPTARHIHVEEDGTEREIKPGEDHVRTASSSRGTTTAVPTAQPSAAPPPR